MGNTFSGSYRINDRVISANNVSLEGVDYATAVQVLRDSGQTVNLVVKRRVVLPPQPTKEIAAKVKPTREEEVKVSLTRGRKKEEFGVVLGCRIYVKEITRRSPADKEGGLNEGDLIRSINGASLDGLSLKEARKLMDGAKDKLDLIVVRGKGKRAVNNGSALDPYARPARPQDAPTPPRPPPPGAQDEDGKRMHVRVRLGVGNNLVLVAQVVPIRFLTPARCPCPRPCPARLTSPTGMARKTAASIRRRKEVPKLESMTENRAKKCVFASSSSDYGQSPARASVETYENKGDLPDPRFISFKKNVSVGIRLTGGNEVGIFVTAVQPGSPAAEQGLRPGDKILKVNETDMRGVTREEAVLFLLSLQDTINLIAQYRRDEYDQIVSLQRGDSFYIK